MSINIKQALFISDKNIQPYSYTPKELKQMSFVLWDSYFDTENDEIKNALDKITPNVVTKVSQFSTPRSVRNAHRVVFDHVKTRKNT